MIDVCLVAFLTMAAPTVAEPPAVERAVEVEAEGIDGEGIEIEGEAVEVEPAPPAPLPVSPPATRSWTPPLPDDGPRSDGDDPDNARDTLVAFLLLGTLPLVLLLAYQWRRCGCGGTMIKLDEVADDAYLSPGQRAEERLGAVDHVVLACPRCTAIAYRERRPWISWFTRCPNCHLRTVRTTAVMVAAPALGRTGLAEHVTWCGHCPHRRAVHYELPALAPRDDDG